MRMSWLYFSTRSPRQGAPVLRWPVRMATVRSAMKLSTVSPERWRHHRAPARAARHLDRGYGFAYGPDLVELDQDGVGRVFLDPLRHALDVGHENVVADQLYFVADGLVEELPALPVVLGEAVLQHDDRIFLDPGGVHLDHLGRLHLLAFGAKIVELPSSKKPLEAGSRAMEICSPGL